MQNDLPTANTTELTERELEILRLIATGKSNKDIANLLTISSNTVKVHLRNIFSKTGVNSRTEAALFAIRVGISQSTKITLSEPVHPVIPEATKKKPQVVWISGLLLLLLAGIVTLLIIKYRTPIPTINTPVTAAPQRWQELAPLPIPRSGLAVAVYADQIYAIWGETTKGVTGALEQYNVESNIWTTLDAKPVPVTDINAAVIGGLIYIPGGRLTSGGETNVFEAYDPGRSQWKKLTPVPIALSGYALVAFEGNLYIFGGWDGQKYLASVYEYQPDLDKWSERRPMPTARAFAGAGLAGGKIFVIGGTAGQKVLAVNEEYAPERDTGDENPWTARAPIPEARYAMGIASIADIIHVIGGDGPTAQLHAYEYFPQKDAWQSFELPVTGPWRGMGVGVVETSLHTFGGLLSSATIPTGQHLVYQAIYTLFIPVIK